MRDGQGRRVVVDEAVRILHGVALHVRMGMSVMWMMRMMHVMRMRMMRMMRIVQALHVMGLHVVMWTQVAHMRSHVIRVDVHHGLPVHAVHVYPAVVVP